MDRSWDRVLRATPHSLLATVLSLAVVFALVAREYLRRYPLPASQAVSLYFAFLLLLILVLVPGFQSRRTQPLLVGSRAFLVLPLWCAPYLLYAMGTGDFRWTALLKLLAIAALPLALYIWIPPRKLDTFSWQDACVALLLIAFVLSGQLRGIWNVPTNLDFMSRLFLITVGAWCWTWVRAVPELGYSFRLSRPVLTQAAVNFLLFAVIAIPASLAMQFTRWNPRWSGPFSFLLHYVEIFLFIALLEELFFRGFLQTLLSRTLRSWVAGQALVSLLFGLFHILHAPFPNWRYVALASVAGWFYGTAFRRSGSLMASSLLHAAVDTVWRTWLTA